MQGMEVKDLVGRLSKEVDMERRAADEADMKAPETSSVRSINNSMDSRGSNETYKSGFIEKAKIPSFSGNLEEYPDFKSQFKDLTRYCGHPPSALLQQLRDRVPMDARAELVGASTLEEAWESLDERFGDSDMTFKMVKEKLYSLQFDAKQPQYENVISLANSVKHAMKLLDNQAQVASVATDKELVGSLVAKLPQGLKDDWHGYAAVVDKRDRQDRFTVFQEWLKDHKERAVFARKEAMISKRQAAKVLVPQTKGGGVPCSKCGSKHPTHSCPYPSSKLLSTAAATGSEAVEVGTDDEECLTMDSNISAEVLEEKTRVGNCTVCQGQHIYFKKGRDGKRRAWPASRLHRCPNFLAWDPLKRAKKLQEIDGCPTCTAWDHKKGECDVGGQSCRYDNDDCKKKHHTLLHDSKLAWAEDC